MSGLKGKRIAIWTDGRSIRRYQEQDKNPDSKQGANWRKVIVLVIEDPWDTYGLREAPRET
jgi:hypothetical protein